MNAVENEKKQSVESESISEENQAKNNKSSDNKAKKEKVKKEKKPKEKLSKYEKRKLKKKRQNDLLNMRGIPKAITTYLVELIFIFVVELIVKFLFGNFAFEWSLLRILLSSGILALIITIITTNLPIKLRRTILIIFNFFIAFYAWLQLGFMNFLGAFISLGNAEQGTKITDYIFEFLSSFDISIHMIYVPFILTILYIVFERYITRDGFEKKIEFKSLLLDFALIVYGALLCFMYYVTLEVDFMQNKFQTVSNKELFQYPSNPSTTIKNFGTTVYFILDVKGTIWGDTRSKVYSPNSNGNQIDEEENDNTRHIDDEAWDSLIKVEEDPSLVTLNSYFKNKKITEKNDHTGMFEGKNLIMIMMESVGSAVFSEEYKDYFPTLYKVYSEGIRGVNNYSPRNNCATGESEMTSQISVYSIETTCTVNTYKNNEYRQALMYQLRNNGYYTSAYHDYTEQYYNRSVYEYKMGNIRYYGVEDLGVNYDLAYKEWPSDLEFFEKAIPKYINQDKFASLMITVTPHTPYIFSSQMGNKHLSLFENLDLAIQTKRYLSKIKEFDLALEHMLKTLEDSGKLDDTVIVLFGDHYPYGLNDKQYQSIANYDIKSNHEIDRTPFIIYNSKAEPEIIEKYTTPLDYTPTLLNLFGIDFDPRLYFGHDIYSNYTDYAVFPDNSWQNSQGYYSSKSGEFVQTEGAEPLTDDKIIAINKEISDMKSMSALAIKKNYYNYLFKYFDEYARLQRDKETNEDAPENDDENKDESSSKDTEEN